MNDSNSSERITAEQSVLGALLYSNQSLGQVPELTAAHFREPLHQRLFVSIHSHINEGLLAEPILLSDEFRDDPAFKEFGGLRYLADLVDRAPPAARLGEYAAWLVDEDQRVAPLARIPGHARRLSDDGQEDVRHWLKEALYTNMIMGDDTNLLTVSEATLVTFARYAKLAGSVAEIDAAGQGDWPWREQ